MGLTPAAIRGTGPGLAITHRDVAMQDLAELPELSQSLARSPLNEIGFSKTFCGAPTAGLQNLCGVVTPRSVGSTPAPLRQAVCGVFKPIAAGRASPGSLTDLPFKSAQDRLRRAAGRSSPRRPPQLVDRLPRATEHARCVAGGFQERDLRQRPGSHPGNDYLKRRAETAC